MYVYLLFNSCVQRRTKTIVYKMVGKKINNRNTEMYADVCYRHLQLYLFFEEQIFIREILHPSPPKTQYDNTEFQILNLIWKSVIYFPQTLSHNIFLYYTYTILIHLYLYSEEILVACVPLDISFYLKLTPFSLLPKRLVYLSLIKEDSSCDICHDTFIGLFTRHMSSTH